MSNRTPTAPQIKLCLTCSTPFTTANANYKYCCAACRKAAYVGKSAEYSARYEVRHSEARAEAHKRWREANPEKARKSTRDFMRRWREEHPEESRARTAVQYNKYPERAKAYQVRYRQEQRDKVLAQYAVNDAVKAGKMPHVKTQICVTCGAPSTEYHHWSYEQAHWLDVQPMCAPCHGKADIARREQE